MTDAIEQFRDAIQAAGLEPPETIDADGALHRFSTNGKAADDSGWYTLHLDQVPAGAFGCWRSGVSETWGACKPSDMTPAERRAHGERMDSIRGDREAERERMHADARERAARIWRDAQPESGEHRYLRDKGVNAYGIRTDGYRLVVPMRDTGGTLHSIQFIDPRGDKRNLTGGRVSACYYAIGRTDDVLCVVEGFATGASVHEATGYAVAVAFDAGNLKPVAESLRAKYPDLRLLFCADNDYDTVGNPGLKKAKAAARAVSGLLAVPDFGVERPIGATDFNDLARHRGLDAVRRTIHRKDDRGHGFENHREEEDRGSEDGLEDGRRGGEAARRAVADAEPMPRQGQPSEPDNAHGEAVESAAEAIARLAGLPPIEYDRVRQSEAERLGVRVGTLDVEVSRLRPQSGCTADAGAAVLFDELEPWPEPVDGAELLDAIADTFTRYLVLPAGAADALALWTTHTHVFDAFEHTPRLNITAPQKQCGKTLLLDVLQAIAAKGLRTENVSTAVLFRLTDSEAPCLLIDECDSFLRDNEELRGALNAGHRRGGRHLRCEGEQNEVRAFKTFAPVVLAGIGSLPGTLADRSIIIRMERAKPGEVRQRFDSRKTTREQVLKRQLIRWSQDNRQRLEAREPELPGLYNRRADNWRPLFALAEVVGAEWLEKVKKAVIALTDKSDESESAGVLLLADIRQIFGDAGQNKLASTYLVDRLIEMEERPWPEFRRAKPVTARQIASLLRPFGIVRGTRRDGSDTFKGYELSQFSSAFSRYLADLSVTRSQPAFQSHPDDFQSVTNDNGVTDTKTPKPAPQLRCDRVTDRKADNGARVWTKPSFTIIEGGQSEPWRMRI